MGSDGMTIDNEGNVYLTGKGVFVFDKSGRQIDHIAIDEPWTANVSFGGRAMDELFITASKALYRLRTPVWDWRVTYARPARCGAIWI